MQTKRINLFMGHYGSGKTHLAVNYAALLSDMKMHPVIADLDIVNPYFRTKDSLEFLKQKGISLIASPFAGSNVDLPALPQEMYSIVDDTSHTYVIDVGGDDRGALALGRLREGILKENNYEAFFVVNFFRPLTRNFEETVEVLQEVQSASGICATALVNCSNLGEETRAEDVLSTIDEMDKLSKYTKLPVKMTAIMPKLHQALKGQIDNLFCLEHHQTHY